jgi:hypothetical protein
MYFPKPVLINFLLFRTPFAAPPAPQHSKEDQMKPILPKFKKDAPINSPEHMLATM